MIDEKFYIVSLKDISKEVDLETIFITSRDDFYSDGHEEFSLSESEVDLILGDAAFCGGDLTEELMNKLESEASKVYKFYFSGEDAKDKAFKFSKYLLSTGFDDVDVTSQVSEDWNESWKEHYEPIDLGRFIILPIWRSDDTVESEKERILINPGMGFGTGTHETTRQCLLSLLELDLGKTSEKSCLDFGAGSGILGIAFQKIHNGSVDFVDIDQRAIENNINNQELNFPSKKSNVKFTLRSEFKLEKEYGLVFANILEHVLLEEFELINKSVNRNGFLIVSGILKEQKKSILTKYGASFKLLGEKCEGDWMALTFEKL